MNHAEINHSLAELNNLLQLLLPEFNAFKAVVQDMVKINSPFQKDFYYMAILQNMKKQLVSEPDLQKTITLIIEELNHFSALLNKISRDNDATELYAKNGILERCVNLQKNIEKIGRYLSEL